MKGFQKIMKAKAKIDVDMTRIYTWDEVIKVVRDIDSTHEEEKRRSNCIRKLFAKVSKSGVPSMLD